MVLQMTGGANAYKDADGFLRIEESEFEAPRGIWGISLDFSDAKQRALLEARAQLLDEIHEWNRRELRRREGVKVDGTVNPFDPTMACRWIDGDPNMSLADIKIKP